MIAHDKDAPASAERPSPEAPSARGLRVMAAVRWLLLALVTVAAGSAVWTLWGPEASPHAAHEEDRFYCPMHPQIRSPRPGQCPICHMHLEPIPAERQAERAPDARAHPSAPADVVAVSLSAEKQKVIGLATSVASRGSLGDRLRVPGVVSAPETGRAEVRVRAPGFVEQVAVRQTGVRVTRGQVLAWIYSPEIYRAQAELIAASRWGDAPGALASGAGEIAPAARRGLELLGVAGSDIDEIARTGKPLRAVPVRAPSAGYVTRYAAVLGTRADPETVLYEIADLSSVWVVASVHERDLASVRAGTPARFTWTAGKPEAVTARVDLVEPALDEATRTGRVRLVVSNPDGRLRPGQFGDVELELPAAEGLFVPRDAVIRTGEHEYVYVDTGGDRFEPRTVRTGLLRDGRTQILDGIAEGERVVTRGSFMLDSESRLRASLAGGR
jgi:Cu(I)/Ag(I) efflux system membrane fusion protein